jgi:hypothetical protein
LNAVKLFGMIGHYAYFTTAAAWTLGEA